ncbi:PqqD family protein [Nocardia sp. NPDC088792]|uniref:PqqD family protein n=1 Tax=Nocardia sp. NPDC088792 TaxID=3364332 RepID=UPI0038283BAF
MSWSPDSVPERRLDIRVRSNRGTIQIVNRTLQAVELTGAGALLFRAMDGRRTVGELAGLLVAEFGITAADALTDTTDLVTGLADLTVIDHAGSR